MSEAAQNNKDFRLHAKEINHAIRQWCGIPESQRNHAWWNLFYNIINQGFFLIKGSITSPDGRQYAAAHLCPDYMIEGIVDPGALATPPREADLKAIPPVTQAQIVYNFLGLAGYAFERKAGLAFVLGEEMMGAPDAILRYGSVWSYYFHGYVAGSINVVTDYQAAIEAGFTNPLTDTKDDDNCEFGEVSSEFFPDIVRKMMLDEIKSLVPQVKAEDVKFYLYKLMRYAMPQSIMLDLGCQLPDQLKHDIAGRLTWYMPPYLPVSIR